MSRGGLVVEHVYAERKKRSVLQDVCLRIDAGERVALIGHNGAGKTTLCRCIFGFHRVSQGKVMLGGENITNAGPSTQVRRGLMFTPQGHNVFPTLSVTDNLRMGVYHLRRQSRDLDARVESVCTIFPTLRKRRTQLAGTLSGGEQQMLALGMAMMARPSLMILDEPSTGLAPVLVEEVFNSIRIINEEFGTAVLVVDQNVTKILAVTHRAYVLKRGQIIRAADSEELLQQESLWELF